MQAGEIYKITQDIPVYTVIVRIGEPSNSTFLGTVLEIIEDKDNVVEVGDSVPIYLQWLYAVEPVEAPVQDGFYRYDNGGSFMVRNNGLWHNVGNHQHQSRDSDVHDGSLQLIQEF